MKINLELKFNSFEELKAWFDNSCTLCAMCNDKRNCCKTCRANKVWKQGLKDFNKEKEYEDDEE